MELTSYSIFRQRLKEFMDLVIDSSVPLVVSRAKGEDVVVMAKSDYESMQETLYLLSSSKNAQRLMESIEEYEEGKGLNKDLKDFN